MSETTPKKTVGSAKVARVVVFPPTKTIQASESVTLRTRFWDTDENLIEDRDAEWNSENERVATVDKHGKVTANQRGTATIWAIENEMGVMGSAKVTVEGPPEKAETKEETQEVSEVKIVPDRVTVTVAGTAPLRVQCLNPKGEKINDVKLTWSSSDNGVATVDGKGKVTAHGEGTATITAQTDKNVCGKATVNVI